MGIASVTAISFSWGTTSRNRYFIIIEFWNFIKTTASVTSISCGHMLHFISQCLSLSMASYHTVYAFPLTIHLNGSLMVSNASCHAKGPRFESRSRQSHKMKQNSIFDKFNLKSSSSFLPSSIVLSTVITIFSRSWRVTMMHDTPCRWVTMSYHDTGVNGSGRYLSSPIYLHQLRKLFKLNFSKIELSFPNRLDRDTSLDPFEHQPGLLTNRLPVTYRNGKHEPYDS
jgi:hypothetical protein